LTVAPGWINVDASLNALFGGSPVILLKLLYRLSGANRYYSCDDYCRLLQQNRFVFHDLARSVPFPDQSVDVVYSSHFLEHLFRQDALCLLREAWRVLRPGGVIRVAVPDLAYALALYQTGQKEKMLQDYFFVEDLASSLARHKYMYDFELLDAALRTAGFREVRRCAFQQGQVPDLRLLDNRPEETLFVEAIR
jgi:SAM-dependent methyltransferase